MTATLLIPTIMLAALIVGALLTAAWWWVLRRRTGWPPFVIDWHVRQPDGCPRFDVGHLTVTNNDNGQSHRYSGWVLRIRRTWAVGLMLRWKPGAVRRTPREWWRHRTEPARHRIAHRTYPEAFQHTCAEARALVDFEERWDPDTLLGPSSDLLRDARGPYG